MCFIAFLAVFKPQITKFTTLKNDLYLKNLESYYNF